MQLLKEKVNISSSTSEKIKPLTLVPDHWTKQHIMDEFKTTYLIDSARRLKRGKGILGDIINSRNKSRITVTEDVKEQIQAFYESEDHCQIMPGKKDCVSICTDNG